MKKQFQVSLLSFLVIMAISNKSHAQTLIHYWSFNNFFGVNYTPNIPPIDADYSDLDTSKARIYYAEMAGVSDSFNTYEDFYATTPADSDLYNMQFGDTAGNSLRLRNPSDSMYLLLYIPTTHFENIVLAYSSESSSATHGMLQQFYSYSLDSGLTWITSGGLSMQYDTVYEAFHLSSVSFTDTNANNNPKLVFRIVFGPNNTGTSGNDRIDNVTVTGDSIGGTAPSAVAQVAATVPSYTLYPNPVLNVLDINSQADGAKSIVIYNTIGQKVFEADKTGTDFSVNLAGLIAGEYYINITEKSSGTKSVMKFSKY